MNVILSVYFQEEERHRRAIWEENVKMIKLLSEENGLGMNNITVEMNEFGDMVSVTQTVPHSSFPLLLFKLSLYVLFLKDWRRDEGNDEGEFSSDSKEWKTHPETRRYQDPQNFGLEDTRLCNPRAETGMTSYDCLPLGMQ